MGISKSLYAKGIQCPKLLWLSKRCKGDESVFTPDASLMAISQLGKEAQIFITHTTHRVMDYEPFIKRILEFSKN